MREGKEQFSPCCFIMVPEWSVSLKYSVFAFRERIIACLTHAKLVFQKCLPLGGVLDGDVAEDEKWGVSPVYSVWAAFTQDSVLR